MISIIMGIYNNESTLAEALDSILAQTYTDWQMIMCDDCSVDNTYKIASEYVNKYPDKFILIKNDKNLGLNQTLNNCLEYATGEYIARMDGDDISLPTRFEKEVDFLNLHPQYALVSTPIIFFDENGDFMTRKILQEPKKIDFIKGSPFTHAPCMLRAEVMKSIGGYSVSNKLLRVEDYHLWYKIYMAGYKGYNLSEPLYKMRDDRNATARRNFKNRLNEAYVKTLIFKNMKLPFYYAVYILRPIILGLLPTSVYTYLHKNKS